MSKTRYTIAKTSPRITKITVSGFKSLVDFEMDLAKFTCLIGLNGSGKSTVIQFMDFLSQLVRGDMEGWLKERHWEKSDVGTRLRPRRHTIDFSVRLIDDSNQIIRWQGVYNISELRCTSESIRILKGNLTLGPDVVINPAGPAAHLQGRFRMSGTAEVWSPLLESETDDLSEETKNAFPVLKVKAQQLSIWKKGKLGKLREKDTETISFRYQGSVLSQLREERLPPPLVAFRRAMAGINAFDMLSPESLRRRTRESFGSIGLGGERLSAFLHDKLGHQGQIELTRQLRDAYSHLGRIFTKSLRSGWKELEILENYGDTFLVSHARHVNDGLLRLIAILAELRSEHGFLLFDEIENGINPELVEFLLDVLTNARQQVMVTTHSPMILNYLEDDIARKSVIYLYKTSDGRTHAIPFFAIPSLQKKLEVMGPGEAFVDTNLVELAKEIKTLTGTK